MMIRIGCGVLAAMALAACGGAGEGSSATAKRAVAGDTIPLAERRAIGAELVFVSERDGNSEVYAVSPAGGRPRRLTDDPAEDFAGPVSPDGRALALVSVRQVGPEHVEQLSLLSLDGGKPAPLGPASARARSPSWAPDGSWLAFESDRASFRDVFRIAPGAAGAAAARLTEAPQGSFEPAVSPDGRWIAFATSRDGDAEVYVMRADGGEPRRLTAFHADDWAPRWSPDGRAIAFLSAREGVDRIFVVRPDGTDLRKLSAAADTGADRTERSEADAAWSPDGARVAYTLRTRDGVSRVMIADARTGAARQVAGIDRGQQPAWSPDGRYLAFTAADAEGDAELWIARADGGGATRITRSPGPDWLPRWAPAPRG